MDFSLQKDGTETGVGPTPILEGLHTAYSGLSDSSLILYITRWAGQSPTWGRPSPQVRVESQCSYSKFLSQQWQLANNSNKKVQQSWQTSTLAMHLPQARLVSMPVIFCLHPSSSIVILVFRPPGTAVPDGLMFYPWCYLFFRHSFSRGPSTDRPETLSHGRSLV